MIKPRLKKDTLNRGNREGISAIRIESKEDSKASKEKRNIKDFALLK